MKQRRADAKEMARAHTVLAVKTLVEIAGDQDQDPRARVAAANAILDRGHGKPAQEIAIENKSPLAIEFRTPLTTTPTE